MAKTYAYNLREFQLKCLESLEALDKVCNDHGISYFMIAGTLLGAVRHKGFIPWDDDIDVGLLREDYDRLLAHADEWFPERFHVVTHENDPRYPKFFAKLEDRSTTLVEHFHLGYVGGVYIDIFPLDPVPDNKLRRFIHMKKFSLARKKLYFLYRDPYKHGKGLFARFLSWLQRHSSREKQHARLQRIMREFQGHKRCNHLMTHDDGTCAYPLSCIGNLAKYEFEGKLFNGPEDARTFLFSFYGPDCLQLPPESKRVSHFHDYCDLTRSYLTADFAALKKHHEKFG